MGHGLQKRWQKSKTMSPESMDFNGPRGQTMMENSENNESQIEGSLWAKGSKKSKILNPESMDFNGPRGPKTIEKIEKMSPKSMDFRGELHGWCKFAANLPQICRQFAASGRPLLELILDPNPPEIHRFSSSFFGLARARAK